MIYLSTNVDALEDNTMVEGHHEIAYCYQRFVICPDLSFKLKL